ncbi:hypothetical protein NDU88_004321 [Pleurodeles waltl]|uniref:Uncharacterized protein n=1 Tax=Pleurodeles waltl TaxID=8319 RepID=A0AAV7M6U3_PLEWA|nr:hypothetical protein NDU88_004321 [Pleurodeles waltl]
MFARGQRAPKSTTHLEPIRIKRRTLSRPQGNVCSGSEGAKVDYTPGAELEENTMERMDEEQVVARLESEGVRLDREGVSGHKSKSRTVPAPSEDLIDQFSDSVVKGLKALRLKEMKEPTKNKSAEKKRQTECFFIYLSTPLQIRIKRRTLSRPQGNVCSGSEGAKVDYTPVAELEENTMERMDEEQVVARLESEGVRLDREGVSGHKSKSRTVLAPSEDLIDQFSD